MKLIYFLLILFCLISLQSCAQKPKLIKLEDVSKHIGDSVIIKGWVYGNTQNELGYRCLIITNSYPIKFVVIIPSESGFVFKPSDLNKVGNVLFVGKLEKYKGITAMKIYSPEQIKLSTNQLAILKKPYQSGKQEDSLKKEAETIKRPVLDTAK